MKKRFSAVILSAALALVLSACGGIENAARNAVGDVVRDVVSERMAAGGNNTSAPSNTLAPNNNLAPNNTLQGFSVAPSGRGNTSGNIINEGLMAVSGDQLIYCNFEDNSALYTIRTDGSGGRKLSDDAASYVNAAGDRIYYRNGSEGGKIYTIRTDGSDRRQVGDGNENATYLTVIDDRMYYIDRNDGNTIYTLRTDGSGRQKLNDVYSTELNVFGDQIYYRSDGIHAMNTDGGDKRDVVPVILDVENLIVENDRLFIWVASWMDIGVMDTNGNNLNGFNEMSIYFFNKAGERIYYGGRDMNIYSAALDGSDLRQLTNDAPLFDDYFVFSVIGERIYYLPAPEGLTFHSIKLDGSDRRTLDGAPLTSPGTETVTTDPGTGSTKTASDTLNPGTEQEIPFIQWVKAGTFTVEFDLYDVNAGDASSYPVFMSSVYAIDGDDYAFVSTLHDMEFTTRNYRLNGERYKLQGMFVFPGDEDYDVYADDWADLRFIGTGTREIMGRTLPCQSYSNRRGGIITFYLDGKDVYAFDAQSGESELAQKIKELESLLGVEAVAKMLENPEELAEMTGLNVSAAIITNTSNRIPDGVFEIPAGFIDARDI